MEENKITRVFPDFQEEIIKLDARLSVVQNPNRPKLANIKIDGTDICAIPAYEIRDYRDAGYCIELPNGMVPHRSRTEAIELVKHTLKLIEDPEQSDAFFGRGQYA